MGLCDLIRGSVVGALVGETQVAGLKGGGCDLTLPILDATGDFLRLIIENRGDGTLLVHDLGLAMDTAMLQGCPATEELLDEARRLAGQYSVGLDSGGVLSAESSLERVGRTVTRVAQACVHVSFLVWAEARRLECERRTS